MTDDMHQKHEAILAEHGTEIKALHRGQDEMRGDIKTILSAVQGSSKNSLSGVITCAGLALTFGLGFMTLVILPMQEDTDKRRLEQDDKNKLQALINVESAKESGRQEVSEAHYESWLRVHTNDLKEVHSEVSSHAISEAMTIGNLSGRLDCIEKQVNAMDNLGLRSELK